MKLLALETSTEHCSVALLNDNTILSLETLASQKHAEVILPMIDGILDKAKLDKKSLDGIVLSVGPGSFTGVRIATSTAQGLALALNLKVAKVTSLYALAQEAKEAHPDCNYVLSTIDARMGEVYFTVFKVTNDSLEPLCEEQVLPPKEALVKINELIKDGITIAGGSGFEILKEAGLDSSILKYATFPQAKFILKQGLALFEQGDVVEAQEALPLYVRNEVTWKKVGQ